MFQNVPITTTKSYDTPLIQEETTPPALSPLSDTLFPLCDITPVRAASVPTVGHPSSHCATSHQYERPLSLSALSICELKRAPSPQDSAPLLRLREPRAQRRVQQRRPRRSCRPYAKPVSSSTWRDRARHTGIFFCKKYFGSHLAELHCEIAMHA